MSFQTISDILVNSQIADLQLSNTVKESQSYSSSVSFTDLVASYKDEPVTDSAKPQEIQSSQTEKTVEKAETEKSDSSEKIEEKKPVESEEKEEVKSENKTVKSDETEKSSKKIALETKATKESDKTEKAEPKDKKVVAQKTNQKQNKDSKLDSKDFARIAEIENSAAENVQTEVAREVSKEIKVPENLKETEENEAPVLDLQVQTEVAVETKVAAPETKEDSKLDFDFKKNESKDKTVTKLDKDGKITVQDLRTEKTSETKKSELKVTDVKFTGENSATITMDLNQADANVLALNDQAAASQGSDFQSMLNNQIQANVPEFVKAGNIILKDNDQGTINLVLHPDDMGNVKIHLSMDGKTVTGHITVATKEALQVFKDNAETLREAFIKSGFDAANFDVAYGNSGSGNQNMNFSQQQDGSYIIAQQVYNSGHISDSLDSMLDSFIGNEEKFNDFSINIVA